MLEWTLFQRQKNAMIKFLPSATEKLNTREDSTSQGRCIHILKQVLFACCCRFLFLFFLPSSLWRNMKSETWRRKKCRRRIGWRTISEVDCNLLQWRSQGSKAMSCWLFNKLQACTAVWSLTMIHYCHWIFYENKRGAWGGCWIPATLNCFCVTCKDFFSGVHFGLFSFLSPLFYHQLKMYEF